MSQRALQLAEQVEQSIKELEQYIQRAPDSAWQVVCSGEQWSAGVVAHHLAGQHLAAIDLIQAVAGGQPLPELTADFLEQQNQKHAVDFAGCTREETLEVLRTTGPAAVAAIRAFTDEQLDSSALMPVAGGRVMTAEQLVRGIMLDTFASHQQSLMATV
jgi:hypothetical protein